MDVYWLEQTEADVPQQNDWLSAVELAVLDALRVPKRRDERRLGMWTAKRALALCLHSPRFPLSFARLEIRHAPSGAPEVFFDGRPVAVAISLSHRSARAMCIVGSHGAKLGCDLELIEEHSEAFIADYFAAEEQWLVDQHFAADRPWIVTLLWSAKESALKALGEGLRLDTRCVIVRPVEGGFSLNGWSALRVGHTGGQDFHGWWQRTDDMVRTVVAVPQPALPVRLITADEFFIRDLDGAERAPLMKTGEDSETYALRRKA